MLGRFFADAEKTRFDATEELANFQVVYGSMKKQQVILNKAAQHATKGSVEDLKQLAFTDVMKALDNEVAVFNTKKNPDDKNERLKEIRLFIICTKIKILKAANQNAQDLYSRRQTYGSKIGGLVAWLSGYSDPEKHTGPNDKALQNDTQSTKLIREALAALDNIYRSLAHQLSESEKSTEQLELREILNSRPEIMQL